MQQDLEKLQQRSTIRIGTRRNLAYVAISDHSIFYIVLFVRFAGFDAVTLANNHLYDFASKGANFTVQVLEGVGIKSFGVNYGTFDFSQASTKHYYFYKVVRAL